jgi:hypothetical protein
LKLARSFLENDERSYRQTVQPGSMIIGYGVARLPESSEEGKKRPAPPIDNRVLDHMTVWRMLTWLGSQLEAWKAGLGFLIQDDPSCDCHRFLGAVAPRKFRSLSRGQKLRQARRLLHLTDEWDRRFPEKFFPRFATRSGFD